MYVGAALRKRRLATEIRCSISPAWPRRAHARYVALRVLRHRAIVSRNCVWLVLVSNPRRINASTDLSLDFMACQRLHYEIMDYYLDRRKRLHRPEGTTELQDLAVSMLGSRSEQLCKAKGADTKSLIPFAILLLERHGTACAPSAARHLHIAGNALMEVIRIQAASGPVMTRQAAIGMYRAGLQHLRAAFLGGVHPLPKHHLCALIERCA